MGAGPHCCRGPCCNSSTVWSSSASTHAADMCARIDTSAAAAGARSASEMRCEPRGVHVASSNAATQQPPRGCSWRSTPWKARPEAIRSAWTQAAVSAAASAAAVASGLVQARVVVEVLGWELLAPTAAGAGCFALLVLPCCRCFPRTAATGAGWCGPPLPAEAAAATSTTAAAMAAALA